MATIVRTQEDVAQDIAVTIVDTDVHPLPVSGEELKSYAPAEWRDKRGRQATRCRRCRTLRHARRVQDELASASTPARRAAGRGQRSRLRGQTAADRRRA